MTAEGTRNNVLDTNTLVSAFLFPDSTPARALAFARGHGRLLASLQTASELADVRRRPKFDRYLHAKRREELVAALNNASEMFEITSVIRECRDPSDDKWLEVATDGQAAAIFTGDADLQALDPWREIRILAPQNFLMSFASIT